MEKCVFTLLVKGQLTGGDIQYGKWCIFTNNALEVDELMCPFTKGCFVCGALQITFYFFGRLCIWKSMKFIYKWIKQLPTEIKLTPQYKTSHHVEEVWQDIRVFTWRYSDIYLKKREEWAEVLDAVIYIVTLTRWWWILECGYSILHPVLQHLSLARTTSYAESCLGHQAWIPDILLTSGAIFCLCNLPIPWKHLVDVYSCEWSFCFLAKQR